MSQLPLYNWLNERAAGVMLHVSSLPSDTGIGNLGAGAYRFIDFLNASGMSIWQICPLGPTGYGDSPYQCFSAFAGNPYFIDLQPLYKEGLVTEDEYSRLSDLPSDYVDYGALYHEIWPILRLAYDRFKSSKKKQFLDYGTVAKFRKNQGYWLEDYALFVSLKESFGGKCWLDWPSEYRDAHIAKSTKLSSDMKNSADAHVFFQYIFYAQLAKLRAYAGNRGVEIMGDAPIFVALDSSDVWAKSELFQIKKNGQPKAVSGVPPDYFAVDGQLWGNPLYDWALHEQTGFAWWIQRIKSNLEFYDIVRLDHFRGFESYWSVSATETTARNGTWIPCPGLELFKALRRACPKAKLVAEDLGEITKEVDKLRTITGLPGMAVLQFAFGSEADNAYLPHNLKPNCVVYSGTHDNDTSIGWYRALVGAAQDHARRYLGITGDTIAWDLIRAAIESSARLAIFPLQDLMSLGSEARLNIPGAPFGNWQWRYKIHQLDQLQSDSSAYLREYLSLYGR